MIDLARGLSTIILLSVISLCAWIQVNEMDGGFLKFILNIITFPLGVVGAIYTTAFGLITGNKLAGPLTIDKFLPHIYGWGSAALLLWSPIFIQRLHRLFSRPIASSQQTVEDSTLSKLEQAEVDKLKREREQAAALQRLNSLSQRSVAIAESLPATLDNASGWLRRAESEFDDRAFSPYWDAVENATRNLSDFHQKTRALTKLAHDYHEAESKFEGDTPGFPVPMVHSLSADGVLRRLRTVVRLGQTDFEFEQIRLQRQTRDVLIAGFQTLDAAISGLEYEIGRSIGELRDLVDEKMTRQSEMLDNIQHKRKPYPY